MAPFNGEDDTEAEEEEEEEEEEESEADSAGVDVLQTTSRPNAVYNAVALHEKLEEIGWPDSVDWVHTLSLTVGSAEEIDVNDDLAREMAFYTQALEGSRQAYLQLQDRGIPVLRPDDYYAEMVKSDSHMLKIKESLLSQKKHMEEAEERRKSREAKSFSKEVQAQKLKERVKMKKQNIESIKKWRKMRQASGFEDDKKRSPPVEEEDKKTRRLGSAPPWDRSGGKAKHRAGQRSSKSRQFRDAKYGHGGKKRFKKINTAESSAGLFGYKRKSR